MVWRGMRRVAVGAGRGGMAGRRGLGGWEVADGAQAAVGRWQGRAG